MNLEAAVITAVCTNKDIGSVLTENADDLFTSHRDVWEGVKSYYMKYKAVPDVEVIVDKFPDFEPVSGNGQSAYYVDKLRNEYIGNRLREIILQGGTSLKTNSSLRVLQQLQADTAALSKFTNIVKDLDLMDVENAETHYLATKARSDVMGGSPGIATGIKAIDTAYSTGMAPGHLIYIIGWPSRGKSWLTTLLAVNAWKQGFRPMIVSLEMSPEVVRDRVYTVMGEGAFSNTRLTRGDINIDDFRSKTKRMFADRNSFIVVSSEGVNDVTPNVVQGKIDQHKPDIVFLDYHQLFTDNRKSTSPVERNMNISREFKLLAINNNIPVVDITAATSNDVSDRNDPPMLAQVAWSKSLEYDADMAMAAHKEGDIIEVVSRKNRYGPEFGLFMNWDVDSGVIRESFDR